ncbi:hypothetical protein B0O99DRAFT_696946 [Bisporella sp. PMI_857]|nr:hypothetical protein B0O99DRAFT_696946 [Bisporella sp. PMI_857]
MCVKEFYGYQCGHCSVPILRQCPLSASNPMYPVCEYPAERPIFVAEFCHPCSRVVWNAKVLAEEEKHRQRHFRGECDCEITFAGEDPERRGRARARGRDKGKEVTNGEVVLYEGGYDDGSTGDHGFESEEAQGPLVVPSEPKDYGGEKLARNGSDAYTYYGIYMEEGSEGSAGLVGPMVPIGPVEMADPNQSYTAAVGGYGTSGGQQLMMGQFGAGMKFYPAPVNLPPPPPPMAFRSPTASMAYSQYDHYQHYGPAHTHQRRIHGHRSYRQKQRPLSRANSVPVAEPEGSTSGSSRPRQVSDVGQD